MKTHVPLKPFKLKIGQIQQTTTTHWVLTKERRNSWKVWLNIIHQVSPQWRTCSAWARKDRVASRLLQWIRVSALGIECRSWTWSMGITNTLCLYPPFSQTQPPTCWWLTLHQSWLTRSPTLGHSISTCFSMQQLVEEPLLLFTPESLWIVSTRLPSLNISSARTASTLRPIHSTKQLTLQNSLRLGNLKVWFCKWEQTSTLFWTIMGMAPISNWRLTVKTMRQANKWACQQLNLALLLGSKLQARCVMTICLSNFAISFTQTKQLAQTSWQEVSAINCIICTASLSAQVLTVSIGALSTS